MTFAPHDHDALAPPRVEEVSDGVFAYVQPDGSWCINNTGFIVGSDAFVSVDAASTERRTRAYLTAIASVTDAPVRTLVNTHSHLDHTNGNCLFGPGVTIVAHEACRADILEAPLVANGHGPFPGVEWGAIEKAPPTLTFTDSVTLWVDDLRCELRYVGTPAHTTNDVIVWLPERSVLFAGDLVFNGGTPFNVAGSISGARNVLEDLRALDPAVIVPGHGDVCDPSVIDPIVAYLDFVSETAAQAKTAGLTPLDAALEADLGEFAGLLDPERLVGNLHRAYAELDGAAPGAPIGMAALTDMVQYNGGRPLRCLA
ncbi:MAG TPA: MBL fold metallo-hydrolase [Acidimicrobiales bacterium]|nr:MBL fold metallo-hydrolase [Acidimicrobiales bacterium]